MFLNRKITLLDEEKNHNATSPSARSRGGASCYLSAKAVESESSRRPEHRTSLCFVEHPCLHCFLHSQHPSDVRLKEGSQCKPGTSCALRPVAVFQRNDCSFFIYSLAGCEESSTVFICSASSPLLLVWDGASLNIGRALFLSTLTYSFIEM